MRKICVVGLGYIGLPTAAMLANHDNQVTGVDINQRVVDALNQGEITIEEPGLQEFVQHAVKSGHLTASTVPVPADTYIIAVPTPITADNKADLSYVESAIFSILPYITYGSLVIVESTISPRTIEDVVCPILNKTGLVLGEELYVAHCPERVLPGQILHELVHNNRIVGGINEASSLQARGVYETFVQGDIYMTDATSAEMAKLMENTFRDVNIALANELVLISQRLGINAPEVIKLANKHPRVNIHQPGPGVGGHCLAVDPYFIVERAPEEARIIAAARKINREMPEFVVEDLLRMTGGQLTKVAVLGITYKGNIDDIRESPAIEVIEHLKERNIIVQIFDPHVQDPSLNLFDSLEDALFNVDCAVVLTDHNEFKHIQFDDYADIMATPLIYDTKNVIQGGSKVTIQRIGVYHHRTILQPSI